MQSFAQAVLRGELVWPLGLLFSYFYIHAQNVLFCIVETCQNKHKQWNIRRGCHPNINLSRHPWEDAHPGLLQREKQLSGKKSENRFLKLVG